MTHFMPRSCFKISAMTVFGVPISAPSSLTVSHRSLLIAAKKVFNILRCSAYCRPSRMWTTFNRFSTIFEAFVPHFYLCRTHCIIPKSLLSHPSSFCGGMFKLNAKFDAYSLLYSLSHFECDDHTVHTLTQWHLLSSLTSTVKSSFTHVHSSPLFLAARLHQCNTNLYASYINNGWTFTEQTSYTHTMEYFSAIKKKEFLTSVTHGWTLRLLC